MLIPVCAPSNLIVSICSIRHVEDISVHSPYLPIPIADIGRREAMWCGVYAFTP